MEQGLLPNFKKLAELGCYRRLRTTFPRSRPSRGRRSAPAHNPARHNIFDFLDRDRRTYLPVLSSAHIGRVERFIKLGRYRIPRRGPELRLLRKSKPFWAVLGEHGIWSTILRVPITFPPDRFYGAQLSAMSRPRSARHAGHVPAVHDAASRRALQGGRHPGARDASRATASTRRFRARRTRSPPTRGRWRCRCASCSIATRQQVRGRRWRHAGRARAGTAERLGHAARSGRRPGSPCRASCRLLVIEMDEHFSLYMTPINIDPEKPAMPISHPLYYSIYLAKRIGPYATLGLAEDTWALNEGVIDEGAFLQQAYDIDRERQDMFFAALDRLRKGALVCVFDATDRIQHMFWRISTRPIRPRRAEPSRHQDAIADLYGTTTPWSVASCSSWVSDDVLMVRVGSRLQLVSAWREPQRLAAARRLSRAQAGRRRSRRVAARRGLVRHQGLLRSASPACSSTSRGARRRASSSRARRRRRLKAEIIAKLNGLRDAEKDAVGDQRGVRHRDALCGPVRRATRRT